MHKTPATRRGFTDSEDSLLIKYLAKYNPSGEGRNGNLLYKALVENVGKWPWAQEHPWQSWRYHYVRDSEYFDARIARFQKKKGIDPKGDDMFHKLNKQSRKRRRAGKERKAQPKPVSLAKQSDDEEEAESSDEDEDEENVESDDNAQERASDANDDKPRGDKKRKTDSGERVEKRKKVKQSKEASPEVIVISEEDERPKKSAASSPDKRDETRASPAGENVETQKRVEPSKEGSPEVIVISEEDEPENSGDKGDEKRASSVKTEPDANEGIEANVAKDPPAPSGSDGTSEPAQDDGEEVDELVESVPGEDGEASQSTVDINNGGDNTNDDQKVPEERPIVQQPIEPSDKPASNAGERLYPDIATLPSPRLAPEGSEEVSVPGGFTSSRSHTPRPVSEELLRPASIVKPVSQMPQEPTPPLSGPETSPVIRPPSSASHTRNDQAASAVDTELAPPVPATVRTLPLFFPETPNISSTQQRMKRKRKRGLLEADEKKDLTYFESQPTSPFVTSRSASPSVHHRRQLPRIVEGPFSSSFSESRRNDAESDTDDDTDDDNKPAVQSWPPRRRQARKVQGGSRKGGSVLKDVDVKLEDPAEPTISGDKRGPEQPEPSSQVQIQSASTPAPSTPPSTLAVLAGMKEGRQNYSQSRHRPSTKELLALATRHNKSGIPSPWIPLRNEPGRVPGPSHKNPEINRHGENTVETAAKRPRRDPPTSRSVAVVTEGAMGRRNSTSDRSSRTLENTSSTRTTALEAIPAKRRDLLRDTRGSKERHSSHLHSDSGNAGSSRPEKRTLMSHASGDEPSPDPFIHISEGIRSATSFKGMSRRRTFGGFAADSEIPRLDLTNMAKLPRRAARHSLLESRTVFDATPQTANEGNAQSSPIVLATSDHKVIYGADLKLFIKLMSENHGFQEKVTWRLWRMHRNLQIVDSTLKEMRISAEKTAEKIAEKIAEKAAGKAVFNAVESTDNRSRQVGVAEGHDTRHDDNRDDDDSPRHSRSSSPSWLTPLTRSSRHSSTKSSSKLSLVPADGTHEPEYSPPQASRAGKFSRLARQGRIKEAFERESRRASRGSISPRKEPLLQKLVFPENSKEVPVSAPETSPEPESVCEGVAKADENDGDGQLVSYGTVWKKEADDVLRSGDDRKLEALEKQMGKHSIKRRTVELLTSFHPF